MSNGDPGLQPQRTALAWNRTALAVFVNAVLVLRSGAHGGHVAHVALMVAGWVLIGGAGAMLACGRWRQRQLLRSGPPPAPSRRLIVFALVVAGAACASGAAAVWLERPHARGDHASTVSSTSPATARSTTSRVSVGANASTKA